MAEVGKIGRYEIISELGRGGMATVYRAHDPRFGRDVAIKVLPQSFTQNPNLVARFEREAQTIAALDHPAIVPVYDFGEQEGQRYLVMRLMTGGSLKARIRANPFTVEQILPILRRVGAALVHAHQQGVVHRDLKPDNILFDQYEDAYLADFGIAHLSRSSMTITGARIGTPTYMSPEQLTGEVALDGRSDIYSLGIVLFEMLTGNPPFRADTPAQVMMKHVSEPVPHILDLKPDLPAEVEAIISRALAKDREQRYSSAAELVAAVTRLVEPELEPTRQPRSPTVKTPFPSSPKQSTRQAVEEGATVLEIDLIDPPLSKTGTPANQPAPPVERQPSLAEGVTVLETAEPEPLEPEPLPQSSLTTPPTAEPPVTGTTGTTAAAPPTPTTASQPLTPPKKRSLSPVWIGAAVVGVVVLALLWTLVNSLSQREDNNSLDAGDTADPAASVADEQNGASAQNGDATAGDTTTTPSTGPASPAYQAISIDSIANSEMEFSSPPLGEMTLENIDFRVGRQIYRSQASGSPDNRYPTRASLNFFIPKAHRLYVLINSKNGLQQHEGRAIGRIIAHCNDTPALETELRLGENIREGRAAGNVISDASQVQQVWDGTLSGGSGTTGYIDMLTIDLPPTCQEGRLNALDIVDTSSETANSLDPGLALVAVTVEYDR